VPQKRTPARLHQDQKEGKGGGLEKRAQLTGRKMLGRKKREKGIFYILREKEKEGAVFEVGIKRDSSSRRKEKKKDEFHFTEGDERENPLLSPL